MMITILSNGSNVDVGIRVINDIIKGVPSPGSSLQPLHQIEGEVDGQIGVSVVFDDGAFYLFSPGVNRWIELRETDIRTRVQRYDGAEYGPINHGQGRRKLNVTASLVGSVVVLLRDRLNRPGFFEGTTGFSFPLAFFDTKLGDFVGPLPEHRNRVGVDHPPGNEIASLMMDTDLDPLDPRWLEKIPPLVSMAERFRSTEDASASARAYQEIIGLSLAGVAGDFEKALVLAGSKGAGKSVLARIPEVVFPPGLVHIGEARRRGAPTYESTHLMGKRLVVFDDCNDLGDVKHFNRLVTAEGIDVRRLGSQTEQWFPNLGVCLTANRLPSLSGDVGGLSRRLVVLWFVGVPEHHRIKSAYLAEVAQYRMEMLAWFLAGAMRAIQRGQVTMTPETQQLVADWETTADPVTAWATECLDPRTDARLPRSVAYASYRSWAERQTQRITVESQTGFSLSLRAVLADMGLGREMKSQGIRSWLGIGLRLLDELPPQ